MSFVYFTDDGDIMTTTEAPGLGYSIAVKIVALGENFAVPKTESLQYEDLSNSIVENFKPIFRKIAGYRRITVDDLKE